jgi:acyl carrier protein
MYKKKLLNIIQLKEKVIKFIDIFSLMRPKGENVMQKKDIDVNGVKERIFQYLVNIVRIEIGNLNDIYLSPFADYGVDSLSVVDFISTVEEKENVMILGDNVGSQIKCLKDIVDLINDCKREEK